MDVDFLKKGFANVKDSSNKVYDYLLNDIINRPNQVWQVDITYIRTRKGFA